MNENYSIQFFHKNLTKNEYNIDIKFIQSAFNVTEAFSLPSGVDTQKHLMSRAFKYQLHNTPNVENCSL